MEINVERLTKHYASTCALDAFTATFQPGVYGILGPNGAGKSTLMNLLTDTVRRETGSILLDGQEILHLGASYRAVLGYMPQQQGYYEEFTVGRFLYYMAALKGMGRKQAKAEICRLLQVVGLLDCLHKKMGALSGGMRQRVLLVQALLNDPKILLLDEPTAGLDPQERIRIRNYISAIAANKIVLLTTHVVGDVESIAEEVIILKKGRIVARDTPAALIHATRPYVSEVTCLPEELAQYQERKIISNIVPQEGHFLLRVVDPALAQDAAGVRVGLDEAYLYFMNR